MYSQASQGQGQPGAGPEAGGPGGPDDGAGAEKSDDDVVDADFEEVK